MPKTKSTYQPDDEEIIAKYRQSGDKQWVGRLFERYSCLVYGVCLKYLQDRHKSNDAVIQIFEQLFEKLKEHNITNFKPWLYRVTANFCLMQLRKEKRKKKRKNDYINELAGEASQVDELPDDCSDEIQTSHLKDAIEQLKPEQKQCIELFYFKEKRYKDIAEITGFSIKQIKSHIQNGKRNLKLILIRKKHELNI